ncbi:hypothetical protein THAOC_16291 [Thalassiosira oceanica]|uniref:Uncharacterized protein n=1 Tax=Thalassiosira oceanica TaxID=159749 RepID=K0SDM8_THAOC|nr:hypothetical protein THAOC_16291 [Thalassiosira oceanica]|eukprot:EJK63074.1 hypothetical protein THAOC_16291 [Thalassiosira oceanica]
MSTLLHFRPALDRDATHPDTVSIPTPPEELDTEVKINSDPPKTRAQQIWKTPESRFGKMAGSMPPCVEKRYYCPKPEANPNPRRVQTLTISARVPIGAPQTDPNHRVNIASRPYPNHRA